MERKIRIGQIGIGHNHGDGKMDAFRKFPERFEVIGFSEDNPAWLERRGNLPCYSGLQRMPVKKLLDECEAIIVETEVPNLTKTAAMCVERGKHIHMDKPASGTLEEFKHVLDTAKAKNLVMQMGYMYRYNPAVLKTIELIREGKLGEIFLKHTKLDGVDFPDNNLAVLEYEKALTRIFVSSVEVNGWGRRQFVVTGSKGSVSILPMERRTHMTYSDIQITNQPYEDVKIDIPVDDFSKDGRYDTMALDFYDYITGIKTNPFTYDHDYLVQKVLLEIVKGGTHEA